MNTLTDEELALIIQYATEPAASLATELQASRLAHRWRPIESAPKDIVWTFDGHQYGSYILVCNGPDSDVKRAQWWQSQRDPSVSNFIADGGQATFPTHWQPLPSAPERSQP